MDRLSIFMVRASLIWLLTGFILGALMLVDRAIPGDWRLWVLPTHGHMLFVGWFVQFALGIAYWLLPRKRSPELPVGYNERPAFIGATALNLGMILRVAGEPLERIGHASDGTLTLLWASGLLQVTAVVIFISQIWPRLYGKGRLGKPATTRTSRIP